MASALSQIDKLLTFVDDEKSSSTNTSSDGEYSYRLDYFPIPARAGAIRLAFYLQDISFDDNFISFPEFRQLQADKALAWMGLPQLVISNSKTKETVAQLGQSNSILRYVARLGGDYNDLYPIHNKLLCFEIDEICDACEDLSNSFGPTVRIKDEKEKEAKRKELWQTRWSIMFEKFNARIERNRSVNGSESGLLVSDSVTIADLKFYIVLKHFTSGIIDYIDKEWINEDKYSGLKGFLAKVDGMDKVKAFNKDFGERSTKYKESQKK